MKKNLPQNDLRPLLPRLLRVTNKLSRLEQRPRDFGTGELLHPSEIHLLDAVGAGRATTVTKLSALFGVTKGAVSQLVSRLGRKGYLRKVQRSDNRREFDLELTNTGRRAFAKHADLHQQMDATFRAALDQLPARDLGLFFRVLERIEEHVDRYLALS